MLLDVLGFPAKYPKTFLNASEKLIGPLCYYYVLIECKLIVEFCKRKSFFESAFLDLD